jgi:prefoldin subunit 5
MCKSTDEVLNSLEDSIKELNERVGSLENKVAELSTSNNKQSLKCLCKEDISGAKNMKYLHLVKGCPIHGHEWEE